MAARGVVPTVQVVAVGRASTFIRVRRCRGLAWRRWWQGQGRALGSSWSWAWSRGASWCSVLGRRRRRGRRRDEAGSKQGEQPWRSQGGRGRPAASTGVVVGDRVELDAARRVPARRGCGFPTVNQTWCEGRSSGEGDDRERKNRSFGKDVAHRCSIARQGGGFGYRLVVRDGRRADVVVVMTKDDGGLGRWTVSVLARRHSSEAPVAARA